MKQLIIHESQSHLLWEFSQKHHIYIKYLCKYLHTGMKRFEISLTDEEFLILLLKIPAQVYKADFE